MKSAFRSFGLPDDKMLKDAWHSPHTLFVFDANVLLNVYGYEEDTKNDFFSALTEISSRIWIPHQVGLEYNRRRLDVIKQEKKTFRDVNSALDKILNDAKDSLKDRKFWQKIPELEQQLSQLTNAISIEIEKCKDRVLEWDKLQPDVRSEDKILDQIDRLTVGKIGPPPPNQGWLDSLFTDGKSRFELKIPPGFQDAGKGKGEASETTFTYNKLTYKKEFGDLIIWMQILEKAKTEKVQTVFFITDDSKTDWWTTIDSGGKKIIGPNEGLKDEFYHETQADLFHMYNTTNFLTQSKKFLNTKVLETSLQDIDNKSNSALEAEKREQDRQAKKVAHYKNRIKEFRNLYSAANPIFLEPNILPFDTQHTKIPNQKFEFKLNEDTNNFEILIKDPELVESIKANVVDETLDNFNKYYKIRLNKMLQENKTEEDQDDDNN